MKEIVVIVLMGLVFGASSPLVFGDHHGQIPAGDGAFVALMVKASDTDAYIQMLKDNPAPFKAIGSTVAEHVSQRQARLSWTDVHMEWI